MFVYTQGEFTVILFTYVCVFVYTQGEFTVILFTYVRVFVYMSKSGESMPWNIFRMLMYTW